MSKIKKCDECGKPHKALTGVDSKTEGLLEVCPDCVGKVIQKTALALFEGLRRGLSS